jgi:low temperature requirement protein LtrA
MPLTKWQPPALRHEVADDGRVTWLELFFDLVYVAALIQLGDRLAGDISWSGVGAFAGVFVILWWTWTGTTAFMNRFAVDDVIHRVLAFTQMFAVGNLAVLAATTPDNWRAWFVAAYVLARLPLVLMYVRVARSTPESRTVSLFLLRWFGGSLVLWVASLAVPGDARFVVWAVALALEFAAPAFVVGRTSESRIHDEHFQERYALFTIIVLGETFVKTLTEISGRGISIETQVFGGLSFLMLIAIWWTYFDDVADAHIRSTSALSKAAGRNRLIWVYTHLPLAVGVTGFGVAAKKVVGVEGFGDALKTNYGWLLVGTLMLALLSVAVLDLVTASPHYAVNAPERVGPRVIAAVAIAALGLVTVAPKADAVVTVSLIAAVVIAQIAVEVVLAQRSEFRVNRQVRNDIEAVAGLCAHIDAITAPPTPQQLGCDVCASEGVEPVQLRRCLVCGHVGCCDDTPGQHARRHHLETGHATIASIERDADWAYCYVHDVSAPGFMAGN